MPDRARLGQAQRGIEVLRREQQVHRADHGLPEVGCAEMHRAPERDGQQRQRHALAPPERVADGQQHAAPGAGQREPALGCERPAVGDDADVAQRGADAQPAGAAHRHERGEHRQQHADQDLQRDRPGRDLQALQREIEHLRPEARVGAPDDEGQRQREQRGGQAQHERLPEIDAHDLQAARTQGLQHADLACLPREHGREQVDDQQRADEQGQQAEGALRHQQRVHLRGVHVLAGFGHVDESHAAAVPRDLRGDGRGDAPHRGAIGARVRHAQLQFVEGRGRSQARHRARGRIAGDDVFHPARRQADVAHGAADPDRLRRAAANAQERGLADGHAAELEGRSFHGERVPGRRPGAGVALEPCHRRIGEVVEQHDLGRCPRAVSLDRAGQHAPAARRRDAGQAAHVGQQRRVDAIDSQGGRDGQAAAKAHLRRAPDQGPAVQHRAGGDQADDDREHHQRAARTVTRDVAPEQAQAGVSHVRPRTRRHRPPA